MKQGKTQSVRIEKNIVQQLKVYAATHGCTIKGLIEEGACWAIGKNMAKDKKVKKDNVS